MKCGLCRVEIVDADEATHMRQHHATAERPRCPECGWLDGTHSQNCLALARLRNREQRVERAAHLYDSFYPERAFQLCRRERINADEIAEGVLHCERRNQERSAKCAALGHPMFGGGRWG